MSMSKSAGVSAYTIKLAGLKRAALSCELDSLDDNSPGSDHRQAGQAGSLCDIMPSEDMTTKGLCLSKFLFLIVGPENFVMVVAIGGHCYYVYNNRLITYCEAEKIYLSLSEYYSHQDQE